MKNTEILKTAINAGVVAFESNFVEDNNIKAKLLGTAKHPFRIGKVVKTYLIEEDDEEIKDKVIYQEF